MKVSITFDGDIVVHAENQLEEFSLRMSKENSRSIEFDYDSYRSNVAIPAKVEWSSND